MATLAALLEQMASQIRETLDDVTDVTVQVEGRMILNPTPPTVDIYPGDPSLDPELRAFADDVGGELLTVRARVPTGDHGGQSLLLALMDDGEDPLSLSAALAYDPTFGGLASSSDLRARSGYVLVPSPGGSSQGALLGCLWTYVVVKAES